MKTFKLTNYKPDTNIQKIAIVANFIWKF